MKISSVLSVVSVLGFVLLLPACGPSEAPAPESSTPTPAPSVPPPPATPTPTPEPTPAAAASPREVFVVTAFQAVSELGTHDFPVGTKVNVLKEEGSEYLVEYEGVGVQIAKTYFSETAPVGSAEVKEIATAPAATPVMEKQEVVEESVVIEETGVEQAPASGDDTIPLDPEQQKVEQITESLREVNKEIRETQAAIQRDPGSAPAKENELENLRRKRDQLGQELTTYGKP